MKLTSSQQIKLGAALFLFAGLTAIAVLSLWVVFQVLAPKLVETNSLAPILPELLGGSIVFALLTWGMRNYLD